MKFKNICDNILRIIIGLLFLAFLTLVLINHYLIGPRTADRLHLFLLEMILGGSGSLLSIVQFLVFQRDKKNIVFEIADFTTLSAFYFILAFLDYKSESLGRYYSYIAIPVR